MHNDTGGVGHLSIRNVRIRRPAALGTIRTIQRCRHPRWRARRLLRSGEGEEGVSWLASMRAARTPPPQGGRCTPTTVGAKKVWEMELDAHADYRGPDDPADAQGQQLIFGQSLNENYGHVVYSVWEAELWSLCRPCRHRSFSTAGTKRGGVMGLLQ
jgi:hypothetical protein